MQLLADRAQRAGAKTEKRVLASSQISDLKDEGLHGTYIRALGFTASQQDNPAPLRFPYRTWALSRCRVCAGYPCAGLSWGRYRPPESQKCCKRQSRASAAEPTGTEVRRETRAHPHRLLSDASESKNFLKSGSCEPQDTQVIIFWACNG